MNSATSTTALEHRSGTESEDTATSLDPSTSRALRQSIEHASHLLPSQGPISIFVHHNTLHAFEELNFEEAVLAGGALYDCEPYLTERRFRSELQSGRIRVTDLQTILLEDLGADAEILVATFGTRYALRLAMLQFPLGIAPDVELQWLITETHALDRFRKEVEPANRQRMVAATRKWVRRDLLSDSNQHNQVVSRIVHELLKQCSGLRRVESWTESDWESFTLRFLWRVCNDGVAIARRSGQRLAPTVSPYLSLRDVLLNRSGRDAYRLVEEPLVRFTAAFLDQGFADWELPHRTAGFFRSFAELYSCPAIPVPSWMRGIGREFKEILDRETTPLESIAESLERLGVGEEERDNFILHSLLALRGWAGLIWQMETNAPWTPQPAPAGSLEGYLAIRLILERYALANLTRQEWPSQSERPFQKLQLLREQILHAAASSSIASETQETFTAFQLAQVRGWSPDDLVHLDRSQWTQLFKEINAFSGIERRRVFHLAYERKYRNDASDALLLHRRRQLSTVADACSDTGEAGDARVGSTLPAFQIVCCIDDREESFRRHLEECDPECETFAAAGFYAVAMYYQGAAEAHYRPLCPIIITPQHYVREEPVFSATDVGEARSQRRKLLGRMTHQFHARSRTLWGGVVTGVLGSLATFPLVARVLAPRLTARLRTSFGILVRPPATELHLERSSERPGPDSDALGYSIVEMAGIVTRILQDLGLVKDFAPLVVFTGHGSSSMNNPHESAYNCGACSGGRGGPNARSFAQMANDPRVRQLVSKTGIDIPDEVRFLGIYHNTCNDHIEYYDLDQLPRTHRELFRRVERSINEARARNAHERARRFESAPLDMSVSEALQHVEERAEDLSQARPEYNHATNSICFVGRREWSRGLFLDRRAFLNSYDPRIDDEPGTILGRILAAAIPVCAGISLEYLFSTVDNEGYGCGSKLPHNIASLAGVMTGSASDIRPGLSAQMIEIHEPMRILFVIETAPQKMLGIMRTQPGIDRLVRNRWIQLAIFDADRCELQVFADGEFVNYVSDAVASEIPSHQIPVVSSSIEWYQDHREHLGFASIIRKRSNDDR
ncbi:MAG: DUF2309 domain-containing protein [Pirellulaceae bacterium]|nr:DUF2309 domain-containing protein [Pirellulaceae bacterium]